MNSKVYRLLRNNKEQGPFTSDELIQKNLKPFDLIWIDGRSTAWSYPGELAEFKMVVEDATEKSIINTLYKKDEAAAIHTTAQIVAVNNDVLDATAPKQKPRYKVSAAWSKIQTITTPLYKNVSIAEPKKISAAKLIDIQKTQPPVSKSLSWEQAWQDWEKEKKTTPVKQESILTHAVAANKKNNTTKAAVPVLEKKFEQSLDTITNNYINNILQQKKRTKSFSFGKASEFVLPSVALIIIFSVAYWFMHNTKVAAPAAQPATQQTKPANQNEQKSSGLNSSTLNNNQTVVQATTSFKETPAINKNAAAIIKEKTRVHYSGNVTAAAPVKTNNNENIISTEKKVQPKAADISNADIKKTNMSAAKQFDPAVINNVPKDKVYNDAPIANNNDVNAAENRPVKRRTNSAEASNSTVTSQPVANTPVIKNESVKSGFTYVSVPEYIAMDNGNGNIKIQNTSDVDLDLAVIDVQYYDTSGRFRKGETLYLHNLKAGKTVIIKTAKDVNSAYATSKVAMVSSDANGVYAVGDN